MPLARANLQVVGVKKPSKEDILADGQTLHIGIELRGFPIPEATEVKEPVCLLVICETIHLPFKYA